MNVVLIGYRGTGKSAVGKILAGRLGWELVSTDEEVVRRAGQPIPEIVKVHGWNHFRDIESDVCRSLSDRNSLVVDTGGGAILRPENLQAMKRNGTVFWLTAEIATIAGRIGADTNRPSLTGTKSFVAEIEEVLRERVPKYRAAADHVIPTDGRRPEDIAGEILAKLSLTEDPRPGSIC